MYEAVAVVAMAFSGAMLAAIFLGIGLWLERRREGETRVSEETMARLEADANQVHDDAEFAKARPYSIIRRASK
jgi:uncharacterized iron-regulated membrane protein